MSVSTIVATLTYLSTAVSQQEVFSSIHPNPPSRAGGGGGTDSRVASMYFRGVTVTPMATVPQGGAAPVRGDVKIQFLWPQVST